jgi:hypothetical protein
MVNSPLYHPISVQDLPDKTEKNILLMFMFNDTPFQVTGSHRSLHFSRRPRNWTDEVNGHALLLRNSMEGVDANPVIT